MLYLIGGPPRCGKTTAARMLARETHTPWLPVDYLQAAISPYVPPDAHRNAFPRASRRGETGWSNDAFYGQYAADEIVGFYLAEAVTVWLGLRRFLEYALAERQDFIVEGFQVQPALVAPLVRDHPDDVRAAFLYKTDAAAIAEGIMASESLDWARRGSRDPATVPRIAAMVGVFGDSVREEAERHCLPSFPTDADFQAQLRRAVDCLRQGPPGPP